MTKRKASLLLVLGVVAGWIAINSFFSFQPARPDQEVAVLGLASYREGMSLREAFETFPDHGATRAELRLLQDNNAAWAARWDLLDKARRSIDVSYFILRQDVFGVAFLGHLLKKAQQGVKVRILLDAFGSRLSWHPKGNDYLDTLVNTGNVEVRMYRPLPNRALEGLLYLSPSVAVASEHDKLLIVDGVRAITGGRNIGTEYFAHPDDAEKVFHDVEVEVVDRRAAAAMTKAFESQYNADGASAVTRDPVDITSQSRDLGWAYAAMNIWLGGKPLSAKLARDMEAQGLGWTQELREMEHLHGGGTKALPAYLRAEVRVLDSTTRFKDPADRISEAGARLIKSARKEIFIQSPYVVLPEEAVDVFAQASGHGVPVVMLTNSPASTDSYLSQAFFLEQWKQLLVRIPTLQLYGNGPDQMIHAKIASFDEVLSLVGTYNLSLESMALNSEVMLAVWSAEFAERLTANPRARVAAGVPKAYHYRIARNADGTPQRDEDGEAIAAFGPEDHTDTDKMVRLQIYRNTLKAAEALPGVTPFF
ncbi:MAG TPA: phosphatidylserine/phosphatidylglycerophosphate/cardiolipin synthase family protein [Gammaproteobacteria bacterium]